MNDVFMTYNSLVKGLATDLGNAVSQSLQGKGSGGFAKIGENFQKTIADAMGQFVADKMIINLIPKKLRPMDIAEKIMEGGNYHAQEVQIAIEKGAMYHASAIDDVARHNEQALTKLVNQIIQSGIDVNTQKISGLNIEKTTAEANAKKYAGLSTTEGIEAYQKNNPEVFAKEARQYYLSTLSGDQLANFRRGEQLQTSSNARINYLENNKTEQGMPLYLTSSGADAYMKALEDRKTSQDLLKPMQSEQQMISDYFGYLNAATIEADEKAQEYNELVTRLTTQITTLTDANTTATGTLADETLRGTNTDPDGLTPTEKKLKDLAPKEAEETLTPAQKERIKEIEAEQLKAQEFSGMVGKFGGMLGIFGAVAGQNEKTAKVMEAVAKIQMVVALYEQVLIAQKAATEGKSFIAALFGFGGRQGGIMNPTGYRSYSDGGVAKGPTSGYPAILHGREAVVPLPNGRSIPVDIGKGNMGTNNVSINVNMSEGSVDTQSDAEDAKALGQAINAAVLKVIETEQRTGGLLGG
jgi:hypothetical protein